VLVDPNRPRFEPARDRIQGGWIPPPNRRSQTIRRIVGFNKIAFTGSMQTGRRVLGAAADRLKHVTLELGGNDPGIVLPDADPQAIAEPLFWSMFLLNGQVLR
jgi:acyl-CoA reductase-like NAD-dependent aldehyde dehydrogenase